MKKPLILLITTATASNKTAEENLGLAYIASTCRANNFEVEIIDGWLENLSTDDIVNKILQKRKPIFIGFSCNQLNTPTAIEIAKYLKRTFPKIPLVAGGFSPTFNPQKFLDSGFDFVSLAEGEETLLKLGEFFLNNTSIENIPGICYYTTAGELQYVKPKTIHNLDSLPFPSRDTMQHVINAKTPVNMCTSRGCTSSCLFCSISAFWNLCDGSKWRGRSLDNIVNEIEDLYKNGARHIKFVDDSFIESPRDNIWCKQFADEILNRNIDIKLRITLKADMVSDDIINHLCKAGCNLFACGIENFSDSALKRMGKKATSEQNQKALDIFKKHNVYVQMGFILFDYGTTMSELKENYVLLKKYSWTICRGVFSEMYAAKGTAYTNLLQKKGVLKCENLENYEYDIRNPQVRQVYKALKTWHISHMRMYNMVIEPINKPKVLSDKGLEKFYRVYLKIREKDLSFMGKVLELVENNVSEEVLNHFVEHEIKNCTDWFNTYEGKIQQMFCDENITYIADDDPFTN